MHTGRLEEAMKTFRKLEVWCKQQQEDVFVTGRFLSPIYKQIAALHVEASCIKPAIENAEAAALFFQIDGNIIEKLNYKITVLRVKRKLSFYHEVLEEAENLAF